MPGKGKGKGRGKGGGKGGANKKRKGNHKDWGNKRQKKPVGDKRGIYSNKDAHVGSYAASGPAKKKYAEGETNEDSMPAPFNESWCIYKQVFDKLGFVAKARKVPKRKVCMLVSYNGAAYQGLQMYVCRATANFQALKVLCVQEPRRTDDRSRTRARNICCRRCAPGKLWNPPEGDHI